MRLFKAVSVYVHLGDHKSEYLPEVKEIIVIKETPKQYLVEANLASGYSSRISKDDRSISFTPVEAWDKYIDRAKKVAANMRVEYNVQMECITYAERQRREVTMNNVKIGGTD